MCACRDAVEEVYPMSKIIEEAKTQKDLYSKGTLQETYYAVLIDCVVDVVNCQAFGLVDY